MHVSYRPDRKHTCIVCSLHQSLLPLLPLLLLLLLLLLPLLLLLLLLLLPLLLHCAANQRPALVLLAGRGGWTLRHLPSY